MAPSLLTTIVTLAVSVESKIYFQEKFDEGWKSRWVESTSWKPVEQMGVWAHTTGQWFGDATDKGIQTSTDAKHYGLSVSSAQVQFLS